MQNNGQCKKTTSKVRYPSHVQSIFLVILSHFPMSCQTRQSESSLPVILSHFLMSCQIRHSESSFLVMLSHFPMPCPTRQSESSYTMGKSQGSGCSSQIQATQQLYNIIWIFWEAGSINHGQSFLPPHDCAKFLCS